MAQDKQYSYEQGIMIPVDFTKQKVPVHRIVVVQEIYCNSGGFARFKGCHNLLRTGKYILNVI